MVVLDLDHFRGDGVRVGIDLYRGKEVLWKHFDDFFVVGTRLGLGVVIGDGFDEWIRCRVRRG